ncbi:exopolysaccharide biosynthesis protein [Alteromonas sp. H39]|uniref:exopolysaccharide biosynthesis protein n=1 Tax=Alteromonas sp. H39 TaxID=3389876 RepID=UPI0039E19D50
MAISRISELLDTLKQDIDGESVSVGEVVKTFRQRGFGPLLLIPALIALFPTGAIPGVPTICGITLFLVCVQIALGSDHPWLPQKLKNRSISHDKLDTAIERSRPYIEKMERLLSPRIEWLSDYPFTRIIAIYSGLFALAMIPLEAMPFAAALPAFAIALTAVGLTSRDGIFILAGVLLQAGTGYLLMRVI